MKSWVIVAAAVCLFGGCLAELSLLSNEEAYRYDVNAITYVGMPEISNQFAAAAIRGQLLVQKVTPNKLAFKLEKVQIASREDNLIRLEPRHLTWDFKPYSEIASELEGVTFGILEDGFITRFDIPAEMSPQAANMHRSLASLIQVPETAVNKYVKHNASLPQADVLHYDRDVEESIGGKCGCHYQIESINDARNPYSDVLNITKIKNYRNCEDTPEWIRTNIPLYECESCESDKAHTFTNNVITTYKIKVKKDALVVEKVLCEGGILLAPYGDSPASEKINLVHNITLKLVKTEQLKPELREGTNLERSNLTFVFKAIEEHEEDLMSPDLKKANPTMLFRGDKCHEEKAAKFISEAAEILTGKATVQELRDVPTMLTLSVKALQLCDYPELSAFYQKFVPVHDKEDVELMEAKLALQVLKWLATNPAMLVIKDLIVSNSIPLHKSAMLLQGLSSFQWSKSPRVLDFVEKMCHENAIASSDYLFSSCIMTYGSLIHQACNASLEPPYPTPPSVDTFLSLSEAKARVKKLKSEFDSASEPAKKLALVTAIGNAAVKKVTIDSLMDIIQEEDNNLVCVRAAVTASKAAAIYPEEALNPLFAIATDRSNDIDLRTAAVDALMYAVKEDPSNATLERLALSTWKNDSDQFKAYVYSTLESAQNFTNKCWASLAAPAKVALQLMDDDDDSGFYHGTNNFYESDNDDLDLQSLVRIMFLGDGASYIPSRMAFKLQRVIGQLRLHSLIANLNVDGLMDAFIQLAGPEKAYDHRPLYQILANLDHPNENKGLKKLNDILNIKPREADDFEAVLTLRSGEEMSQHYVNTKKLVSLLGEYIKDPHRIAEIFRRPVPINFVRAQQPVFFKQVIPCELGFPVRVFVRTPSVVAVTGKIEVSGLDIFTPDRPHLQVHLKLNPKYTAQRMITMGFVVPDKEKLYCAGYDTRVAIAPSVDVDVNFDGKEKLIRAIYKPAKHDSEKDTVIASFRSTPFTAIYPFFKIEPIREHCTEIRTLDSPRESTHPIMKTPTNALVLEVRRETFWNPIAKAINDLDLSSPLELFNFFFVTEQWRYRRIALKWDRPERNPEDVEMSFVWNFHPSPDAVHYNYTSWGLLTNWGRMPVPCADGSGHQRRPSHSPLSKTKLWQTENEDDDDEDPWHAVKSPRSHAQRRSRDSDESYDSYNEHRSYDSMKVHQRREEEISRSYMSTSAGQSLRQVVKKVAHGVNMAVLKMEAKVGSKRLLSAKWNVSRDLEQLNTYFGVEATVGEDKICAEAAIDYPKPPCYHKNKYPEVPDEEIETTVNVHWGKGQCEPSKYIKIQAKAMKSEDQKEYDSKPETHGIKPWYYMQCKEDRDAGYPNSFACDEQILDESRLNRLVIKIDHEKVPPRLQNITLKALSFMKYCFYDKMSRNAVGVQNKENQIKIEIEKAVETEAVDIKIFRPKVDTHFYKIHYPEFVPFIRPFNLRNTFARRVSKYVTDYNTAPECSWYGTYMNSFANTTLELPNEKYKYVMARDCSHSNLYSVNVIPEGPKEKKLEVRLLMHSIEIDGVQKDNAVKVDGQVLPIGDGEKVVLRDPTHNKVLAVILRTEPVYNVIAPHLMVRVTYDGLRVDVQASHLYNGRACGLCGDMDPETDDLIGPKECTYAEVDDFANSWAVSVSGGSQPRVTGPKSCEFNTPASSYSYSRASYSSKPFESRQRSSASSSVSDTEDCEALKHLTVVRPERKDKRCFSIQPVTQCESGCKPAAKKNIKIPMHCIDPSEPKARELLAKVNAGKILPELRSKKSDIEISREIPTSCVPA